MRYTQGTLGRMYILNLHRGEDVQQEVERLVRTAGIRDGVVCAGLGGFDGYELRMPGGSAGGKTVRRWDQVLLQLSSLQGVIEDGRPVLYSVISLDDQEPETFAGQNTGHGTRKFYCQIMIWEIVYEKEL